jgi:hypothetical protein
VFPLPPPQPWKATIDATKRITKFLIVPPLFFVLSSLHFEVTTNLLYFQALIKHHVGKVFFSRESFRTMNRYQNTTDAH